MKAFDPYAVLGVPRDADAAAIKAAYRREASKAHPDRHGGDNARMQAVNAAHAILGDPSRKARYDRTGATEADPLEKDAMDAFMQVLSAGLDSGAANVVAWATARLEEAMRNAERTRRSAIDAQRKLRARLKRVRHKGAGADLFAGLVEQRLAAARNQQLAAEHGLKVVSRAMRMLREYEEEDEPPRAPKMNVVMRARGSPGTGSGTMFLNSGFTASAEL